MKRQLTDAEKARLIAKHRRPDGYVHCFVDDERIENEKEIYFDHIEPFAKVEETSLDNMAPVCRNHNLAKKDMTLSEYRDKLQMEDFFDRFETEGTQAKLDDVLSFKYGEDFGFPIDYDFDADGREITVKYYQDKERVRPPRSQRYSVYQCPITMMYYFYALVPTKNILNDGQEGAGMELQPRPLIFKHLWGFYRHLRVNTQLQPSICRVEKDSKNSILVFDGQHKAAAKIWAGTEFIEVKIFIEPDVVRLMGTNLVAHDKLKQLRFYSSILADKMSQLYGVNWQRYIETADRKSEKGFCKFMKYVEDKPDERPEKQIEAFLITSILDAPDNLFTQFVSPQNKTGKKYAISWDSMRKYYFRYFLTRPPLDIEIDSKEDYRNKEIKNNVRLLNLLANETLMEKWNPSAANATHKKTERIYRPGAILGWFPILRDVIYNKLDLVNPEEAKKLLFRFIAGDKWTLIEKFIERVFSHGIWIEKDTNIDVAFGNKKLEVTQQLFERKGFTTQWVLGINVI